MQFLRSVILLLVLTPLEVCLADEFQPVDATRPEHLRIAIARLNDPDFQQREAAENDLFSLGLHAIGPLAEAAANASPEMSIRAFEVLQRLYLVEDEPVFEAIEESFRYLRIVGNLAVAARVERVIENISKIRQRRAIVQLQRLGGVIHLDDQKLDQQDNGRPVIEYILLGREWVGGDSGLRFLERIEDTRSIRTQLYLIRGVNISQEAIQDLRFELPSLTIQFRGPARLGVRSNKFPREEGCVISSVDPGSAADRAGLEMDDVITRIDGRTVENFEGLIEIIETKEPGDRVPIVFRRGTEIREVITELSPWTKPSIPVKAKP